MFAHPALDVASSHLYETGTIDHPRDTLAPALAAGRLVREALAEAPPGRPYFDSEHGPIHTFKDRRRTLPEPFDDAYFRRIQWAHLAAGGAGGGMRWPNRHPHTLTHGMRAAQRALADFLPLLDWTRFQRRNLNTEVELSDAAWSAVACGDERQAVAFVLAADGLTPRGAHHRVAVPAEVTLSLPGLGAGRYAVTVWDTTAGAPLDAWEQAHDGAGPFDVRLRPPSPEAAVAVRQQDGAA